MEVIKITSFLKLLLNSPYKTPKLIIFLAIPFTSSNKNPIDQFYYMYLHPTKYSLVLWKITKTKKGWKKKKITIVKKTPDVEKIKKYVKNFDELKFEKKSEIEKKKHNQKLFQLAKLDHIR